MIKNSDYMLNVNQHVGNKIYSLRLEKKLTAVQLASMIGVSDQQLRKYEKGINTVTIGRLLLIAKALSTNVLYFYNNLENATNKSLIIPHGRIFIEISNNLKKIKSNQKIIENTLN